MYNFLRRLLEFIIVVSCLFFVQPPASAGVGREIKCPKHERQITKMCNQHGNVFYVMAHKTRLKPGHGFGQNYLLAISYSADKIFVNDNGDEYVVDSDNSRIMGFLQDQNIIDACRNSFWPMSFEPFYFGYKVNLAGNTNDASTLVHFDEAFGKGQWQWDDELTAAVTCDLERFYLASESHSKLYVIW